MTGLLAPGRRAATVAAPRWAHTAGSAASGTDVAAVPWGITTTRWRTLRGVLTMAVLGAASITGVQLGVTGPVTSPVQPPAAQAAAADDGQDVTGDDDPQGAPGAPGGGDRGRGTGNGGRR